jgi:L-asparaginase II
MSTNGYAPVYQLTRGGIVESLHIGAAAVVDTNGNLLAAIGDPNLVTFMRSTAKPFQALPFVERGGPAHFNLTVKETALTCASHKGTDDHHNTALQIQQKAGFTESDLQCGTHMPGHKETRYRMIKADEKPSSNRHNCSGKHSGMLAYAQMMGWPLENYLDTNHPIQQKILRTLSEMSGIDADQISIGIDGCSAPNFALPLYNAALAYAHLADPSHLSEKRAQACAEITSAMSTHPDMIAGPGEFDTLLMEAGAGQLVAKGGAEGYQGIGLRPGAIGENSPGIGIAIKIADGSYRALASNAVSLSILHQIGFHLKSDSLAKFGPEVPIKNYKDIEVGTASPCFELNK